MEFNKQELEKSYEKDFAYWIGVVQSDGCLSIRNIKNSKSKTYSIVLGIGKNSLPMLNKFRDISRNIFRLKGSSCSYIGPHGHVKFVYSFGCTHFVNLFKFLQIDFKTVNPPDWILENKELYGSYLAGVIDGDGDTRISRPKYPQCCIRIYSGVLLEKFVNSIKTLLNCGVFIEKRVRLRNILGRYCLSKCYTFEFKVSSKNIDFFKKYVVDNIAMDYKRKIIQDYIKLKDAVEENRTPAIIEKN